MVACQVFVSLCDIYVVFCTKMATDMAERTLQIYVATEWYPDAFLQADATLEPEALRQFPIPMQLPLDG